MSAPTCEECGFDFGSVGAGDAPGLLRGFGRRYRAPLTRFLPGEDGAAVVRARPADGVWSALEYAAHVRDVFGWYLARVGRILVEDKPVFDPIYPDEAAAEGRYNEADPEEVADALAAAAEALAARFESVPDGGWGRVGYGRGGEWTVLDYAQRAVHEGNHHLLDIGRGLRAVRSTPKP